MNVGASWTSTFATVRRDVAVRLASGTHARSPRGNFCMLSHRDVAAATPVTLLHYPPLPLSLWLKLSLPDKGILDFGPSRWARVYFPPCHFK